MRTKLLGGMLLVLTIGGPALAQPSLEDRRQAACYNDVQKFCGQYVPDVGKVTACMKPLKHKVSAKCRALWDARR